MRIMVCVSGRVEAARSDGRTTPRSRSFDKDPSTRLYFSSQRATGDLGGITYEFRAPFTPPLDDDDVSTEMRGCSMC